jgi:hypothetical protein
MAGVSLDEGTGVLLLGMNLIALLIVVIWARYGSGSVRVRRSVMVGYLILVLLSYVLIFVGSGFSQSLGWWAFRMAFYLNLVGFVIPLLAKFLPWGLKHVLIPLLVKFLSWGLKHLPGDSLDKRS